MLHQADFVTLKLRSAFDGCGLFEPSVAQFVQVVVMTVFLILSYLILSVVILVDTFIIYVANTLIPHVRSQVTRCSTITARLPSS